MYFADDTMQGMDMSGTPPSVAMSNTSTVAAAHTQKANSGGIQSPTLAFPVISAVAIAIMLGIYWLLKRFTSWKFPINKKGSK